MTPPEVRHSAELDMAGYHRLPFDVRQQFDDWLTREGLVEHGVFYVKLGEGVVTVGRYLRDADGKRYFANRDAPREEWVVASEYVDVPVSTLPPIEAFR